MELVILKYIEKHQNIIEQDKDYIYNGTYEVGEIMINNCIRKASKTYVLVTHKYCNEQSCIRLDSWKDGRRPHNAQGGCCCGSYENSFAYYIEVELGLDINKELNMVKNKKLGLNPYHLHKQSTTKIWFLCQNKDYHNDKGGYEMDCHHYYQGNRCTYCAKTKLHPKDSFAQWLIDKYGSLEKYWSKENIINPWTIPQQYNGYVFIICQSCNRIYKIKASNFFNGYRCNICNKSAGESEIYNWLENHNIDIQPQKSFNDLLGVGGKTLPYDFYLPEYNLLIEYQGEFHDGTAYRKGLQTKNEYLDRIEHDKRKRVYAIKNNIKLIEIWYWDFNKIDEILTNILLD